LQQLNRTTEQFINDQRQNSDDESGPESWETLSSETLSWETLSW
jgi:hypothetical protein